MPWKVSELMSERMGFVLRLERGERMSDLCREYGISRKTGYKFLSRFRAEGAAGLMDKSRRPWRHPNQTPPEVVELVAAQRRAHPTWGPKKLRWVLEREYPGVKLPAQSTIALILKQCGFVKPRTRRRKASPSLGPLRVCKRPNEVWSIDFKGQFRMGNRRYCYPLTLTDNFSRMILACEALESTKATPIYSVLEQVFMECGLPEVIRSDNGSPFASSGLQGLTQLSVWLLRLGIELERIEPGHPEQNGRHERMHLTLKQETTRPAKDNLLQQQERFDSFRAEFNERRPHEALGMRTPTELHESSKRAYPETMQPLEYPLADLTQRVFADGSIYFQPLKKRIHVTAALANQDIGLRQLTPQTWLACFMDKELGIIDLELGRLLAVYEPIHCTPESETITDV